MTVASVVDPPGADVLIVGYGNVLRSDDGVGWAVAASVASDPRLAGARVCSEHQLTPELALDAAGASLVILVDAGTERGAGEVAVRRLQASDEGGSAWSHHLEPGGLAALARELWGAAPPVFVVSVGVATLDAGDRLSPVVAAAVPGVVDVIAGLVADHARFREHANA